MSCPLWVVLLWLGSADISSREWFLAWSYGRLIFNFPRKFHPIFYNSFPIYIPRLHWGSLFSTFLSAHSISCLFDNVILILWDDISLRFLFSFLWLLVKLHTFSHTCWLIVCILWKKNVDSGPLPILIWVCFCFFFLLLSSMSSL